MLGFTAFEVHEDDDDEVVVAWGASVIVRSLGDALLPVAVSSLTLMNSLLVLVDTTPEMFEVKVWKSPTSPEVAGDEVVLVGELDDMAGKDPLSWDGKEEHDEVLTDESLLVAMFSDCVPVEQLFTLESVGNGNSSR